LPISHYPIFKYYPSFYQTKGLSKPLMEFEKTIIEKKINVDLLKGI